MSPSARTAAAPATEQAPTAPPTATDGRRLGWLLVGGGIVGLVAAFILLVEKIAILKDPAYVPSCSISPLLNCGSVMRTPQAEAFGFPNPILGVAGFAMVAAVGMALLAGASFRRWFWLALQAGVTFGVVFAHWLVFQSLYRIGALCPYCMVVWIVTIALFWYVTLHNVRASHLPVPAPSRRLVDAVAEYHGVVLTSWYLTIIALIGEQFWTYWMSLLT